MDTGESQSYMSKSFYMQSKILHTLPKFAPTMQRIQVGNGQYVVVLSIVPVIIHSHLFEVFTLVLEIYDNVRFGTRNEECLGVGRYNRYARLLVQIFEQVNTIFLKRTNNT